MKSLAFAAILVSLCAAAACSSDSGGGGGSGGSTDGSGGAGGQGTPTSSSSSSGPSGSSSSSSSVTTGPTSSSSSGMGGTCDGLVGQACVRCCVMENQQGALDYFNALYGNCACAAGATCNTQCNSDDPATDVCTDDGMLNFQSEEPEVCSDCMQNIPDSDACIDAFGAACEASADCVAFVTCGSACPPM